MHTRGRNLLVLEAAPDKALLGHFRDRHKRIRVRGLSAEAASAALGEARES